MVEILHMSKQLFSCVSRKLRRVQSFLTTKNGPKCDEREERNINGKEDWFNLTNTAVHAINKRHVDKSFFINQLFVVASGMATVTFNAFVNTEPLPAAFLLSLFN